jgi:multidrug efflux pump subunit AcrB
VLAHRAITGGAFMVFALASVGLIVVVGQNFFPYVDAGQMRLHVRCPTGTRIEEAAAIFASIEDEIRRVIPAQELDSVLDNIGLPNSGINLAFSDSITNGNGDGETLISLKPNHHPTLDYTRELRNILTTRFPAENFFFQAADITSQILNFGLPAPVDVQVIGANLDQDFQISQKLQSEIAGLPGAVDVFVRQHPDYPTVNVNVDRILADEAGLTQKDVATSLLISLSASGQIAPNQWLDPKNGVNYQVAAQTPQYKIDTFEAMRRTPITAPSGGMKQLLYNLAGLNRANSPDIESHYDIQPVIDIFASPDQRDLEEALRRTSTKS